MRSLVGIRWTCVAVAVWLTQAAAASAQLSEQSFTLQPGWNAVYLELDPDPDDVSAALGGLPITAVWTHGSAIAYLGGGRSAGRGEFDRAARHGLGLARGFHPSDPSTSSARCGRCAVAGST